MENIIEELIADFHARSLPAFTRRDVRLPGLANKIDAVIGMRRSGKTWFVFQAISDLLSQGVPKESVLYLNLEDERLLPMTPQDLHRITEVYFRRYPHLRDGKCYFFLDEIQNIVGWERFIRRLLDTENLQICLTGSSAKLLSREIATSLRGRSIATEIFPFSFRETLRHAGLLPSKTGRPDARTRALLENRLRNYLLEGGFPEVQGIEAHYRIRILQDYVDVVVLRDLIERHGISNTAPLRYMIRHMMNNAGGLFSVNKFFNDLRSQGIPCGKNTLHEYLGYLEDTFLFFAVPVHAASERARMVNPRKIYAIDPGLIHNCSRGFSPNWGHLLENFVFLEIRRSAESVRYYKTGKGREVDFIVTEPEGTRSLLQVSMDMREAGPRRRELEALEGAMKETGIKEATVVTLEDEEEIDTEAGRIHTVPAWWWALRN